MQRYHYGIGLVGLRMSTIPVTGGEGQRLLHFVKDGPETLMRLSESAMRDKNGARCCSELDPPVGPLRRIAKIGNTGNGEETVRSTKVLTCACSRCSKPPTFVYREVCVVQLFWIQDEDRSEGVKE